MSIFPKKISFVAITLLMGCAAPRTQDDSLYRALDGDAGIARLVDALVDRCYSDPRIEKIFRRDEDQYFRARLREQICQLSGGGCEYTGLPMDEAHNGLKLGDREFNAFVEDARQAMTEVHLKTATQNQLLALLAPMHHDIVHQ